MSTASTMTAKFKSQPSTQADTAQINSPVTSLMQLRYKAPAPCVVDRVLLTANETDQFLVKVMVRQCRRPEIGDKFASRHGQKGVCGAIIPQVYTVRIACYHMS